MCFIVSACVSVPVSQSFIIIAVVRVLADRSTDRYARTHTHTSAHTHTHTHEHTSTYTQGAVLSSWSRLTGASRGLHRPAGARARAHTHTHTHTYAIIDHFRAKSARAMRVLAVPGREGGVWYNALPIHPLPTNTHTHTHTRQHNQCPSLLAV